MSTRIVCMTERESYWSFLSHAFPGEPVPCGYCGIGLVLDHLEARTAHEDFGGREELAAARGELVLQAEAHEEGALPAIARLFVSVLEPVLSETEQHA